MILLCVAKCCAHIFELPQDWGDRWRNCWHWRRKKWTVAQLPRVQCMHAWCWYLSIPIHIPNDSRWDQSGLDDALGLPTVSFWSCLHVQNDLILNNLLAGSARSGNWINWLQLIVAIDNNWLTSSFHLHFFRPLGQLSQYAPANIELTRSSTLLDVAWVVNWVNCLLLAMNRAWWWNFNHQVYYIANIIILACLVPVFAYAQEVCNTHPRQDASPGHMAMHISCCRCDISQKHANIFPSISPIASCQWVNLFFSKIKQKNQCV